MTKSALIERMAGLPDDTGELSKKGQKIVELDQICTADFKRQLNASWTFAEMLSDDEDVRKAAIVHSLETGAELWRTGCRCNRCRDAYLKVVRSLVGE